MKTHRPQDSLIHHLISAVYPVSRDAAPMKVKGEVEGEGLSGVYLCLKAFSKDLKQRLMNG